MKIDVYTLFSSEQTAIVFGSMDMLYPDEDTFTLHEVVSVCLGKVVEVSHPAPLAIQKVTNHRFVGLGHQVLQVFLIKDVSLSFYFRNTANSLQSTH